MGPKILLAKLKTFNIDRYTKIHIASSVHPSLICMMIVSINMVFITEYIKKQILAPVTASIKKQIAQ